MSLETLVDSVRNHLLSHYMYAHDEWLTGFIEYFSGKDYKEEDLNNVAREQWLLNDLKEICPGCLPANLKAQMHTILNGKFVLQINASFDIGTPAYQQYLKLQKVNMENIEATTSFEEKIPSHRMIKLYLTDGVQDITAIEYKPMRNLSCNITPGCKILIKGPIECRRGMLLLTENVIELLGGELQDIAVSNSLAGLISQKLDLRILQDPIQNDTTNNTGLRTNNIPDVIIENQSELDQIPGPVAGVTSLQGHNDGNANQHCDNPVKRSLDYGNLAPQKRLRIDTTVHTDDYPDDNELLQIECDTRPIVNNSEFDDDFPEEDEEYLREMEAMFDAKECEIIETNNSVNERSSEQFVCIKQINELSESDKVGKVFNVKGQILKLLSKLSVGKDGWSLKCTIVDGTGSLDVEFTSDVLSKLIGFTPQEMNQIKKEMETNPDMKLKAVSALQAAKEALQVLSCIIELTMRDGFKITKLTPFGDSHDILPKTRLQSSVL